MNKIKEIKFLIRVIKKYKKPWPLYFFYLVSDCVIQSICYNIVLAYISKDAINAIITGKYYLMERAILIAIVSFIFASVVRPFVVRKYAEGVRETISKIRNELLRNIEYMDIEKYENMSAGDLITVFSVDINNLYLFYRRDLFSIVFALFHGFIAITAMLSMNVLLTIISLTLGISCVVVNYFISKKVRSLGENFEKINIDVNENTVDFVRGIEDIKNSSEKVEDNFLRRFLNYSSNMKNAYIKKEKTMSLITLVNFLFNNQISIGILVLGLFLVERGYMGLDVGTVIAIIALEGNAGYLFGNISSFMGNVQNAMPSIERVFKVLQYCGDKVDNTKETSCTNINNERENALVIEDLKFSYDGERKLFNNLKLSVKKGEFIGIVGESGVGKTTLLKIILGLYKNYYGKVIRNEEIAYVPQDAILFNKSIKENISIVGSNVTDEEIYKVCRLAHCDEFIESLPEKYDTIINEKGENISGGERQRIAIARALITHRKILIMDEGTSALDMKTTSYIKELLCKLKGSVTIILICHDKSVLEDADRVYKLNDGILSLE